MKALKNLIFFLLVGVFVTSCDKTPVDIGRDNVIVSIVSPESSFKTLINEDIPCSVEITPSNAKVHRVEWKANGQLIECVDGHFSLEESGEYRIGVEVFHEGGISRPFSGSIVIEIFPYITGKVYPINSKGEIVSPQDIEIEVVHKKSSTPSKALSDGSFRIRTEVLEITESSFDICVYPSGNDYYSSCVKNVRISKGWSDDDFVFNFVLVPKKWHVQSEVYNEIIDIDLTAAFERNADEGKSSFFASSKNPLSIKERPTKMYFSQEESDREITKEDSLFWWSSIEGMEQHLGIGQIFTPADIKDIVGKEGVKVVYSDSVLPAHGTSYGGKIVLSHKGQDDPSTIMHESIHEIGMGHTCGWYSILNSGCGVSLPDVPTIDDVVYIQLLFKVKDIQTEVGAQYGIWEAYQSIKQ